MSQGQEEWEEKLGERRSLALSPALCCGGFMALARRSGALLEAVRSTAGCEGLGLMKREVGGG